MPAPASRDPARRTSFISMLLAIPLGAICVAAFEPIGFSIIVVLALAFLFKRWAEAGTPRAAFLTGYGFGLGYFLAGVSWIYVSLATFGAMPMPLAAIATFLFCAFLALFPAVTGYVAARVPGSTAIKLLLAAPAAWALIEWVRCWIFTGFPWLSVGYSQAPGSPLAGFAPIAGVFGVSLAVALSAGALALALLHRQRAPIVLAGVVALWLAGFGLKQIAWTKPTGVSTTVDLLQGNIPQDIKWSQEALVATLNTYRKMVTASSAQLIVLPETALPLFLDRVPADYLNDLAVHARKNKGDILIGVPEQLPSGAYYNSVISLGSAAPQVYRKSHLVPFGEFIPVRPVLGWIVGVLSIPLQDFARGSIEQQPLNLAGQRVAVNICYEDVFGEEIIRQLPRATMLVNASNVAWFGRSIAPRQHLQISQMRALETGRYMLRATNTGVTAVIDERGIVKAAAPEYERVTISYAVPGFEGVTPYVRWGNYAFLLIAGIMLLGVPMSRQKQ